MILFSMKTNNLKIFIFVTNKLKQRKKDLKSSFLDVDLKKKIFVSVTEVIKLQFIKTTEQEPSLYVIEDKPWLQFKENLVLNIPDMFVCTNCINSLNQGFDRGNSLIKKCGTTLERGRNKTWVQQKLLNAFTDLFLFEREPSSRKVRVRGTLGIQGKPFVAFSGPTGCINLLLFNS